jgi:hypothetical protein
MKRITIPATLALAIVLFSACTDQPKPPPKKSGSHSPAGDTQVANNPPGEDSQNPDKPAETKPPGAETKPPPAVPEAPKSVGEIPYAKPVPGKPGFVFSPYDQYKGYIDVRGFPPGTEVKDPYSGKSFLVP